MTMVAAIPMTREQIKEFADQLQHDSTLWNQFVELELDTEKRLADAAAQERWVDDPDVVLDPPKLLSMDMLVFDFLKGHCGGHPPFDRGALIIEIRRRARLQLGLPV
jgi:hypothetical protein